MFVSTTPYTVVVQTCEPRTPRSASSACINGVAIRYQKTHHDMTRGGFCGSRQRARRVLWAPERAIRDMYMLERRWEA